MKLKETLLFAMKTVEIALKTLQTYFIFHMSCKSKKSSLSIASDFFTLF